MVRLDVDLGPIVSLGSDPGASVILSPAGDRLAYVSQGAILAVLAFAAVSERAPGLAEFILIAAYSLLMTAICLLACVAPASRALRAQPAQVLTADT
jgi:hypothetical protein